MTLVSQHAGHYTTRFIHIWWVLFKKPTKYLFYLLLFVFVFRLVEPVRYIESAAHLINAIGFSAVSQAASQDLNNK